MTIKRAIEVLPTLRKLAKQKQKAKRKIILKNRPCKVYHVLSDISKNILSGKIRVRNDELKKLRLYKSDLRKLAKKNASLRTKKAIVQKGGFLPFLIKPALTLLATYAATKLAEK